MRANRRRSRRQGFTLVEMLAVAAIVVILLGISAVGVAYYARWLKITELDNAAREIYLAAGNRAVLLSGSSRLETLVTKRGTGVTVTLSSDSGSEESVQGYYIHHSGAGSEVADLLPVGTIDSALMEGSFYIVYEPVGGSVTDVFYAESEPEVGGNFQAFYEQVSTSPRSVRMGMKPMVGYYGGGKAENARDDALGVPIVTIKNEDTLTAEITYTVLPSMAGKAQLDVALSYGNCTINITEKLNELPREETNGRVRFTYTILLDSLEDGKHFSDLFRFEIGRPASFGGDFTVTATLTAEGATPSSGSDTDNSLFAEGSGGEAAYIANLRHLQNLDQGTSGVGGKTAAEQRNDIDCSTYLEADYIFTPIQNDGLMSYDGKECVLRGLSAKGDNAGLFASVTGTGDQLWQFKNIRMVNASAVSGDGTKTIAAGALAGAAENAAFTNCWVYWEPEAGAANLRGVLGDDESGYRYQIIGDRAGGLAGQLNGGTITDCLAATLVQGQTVAGGLVGAAEGTVAITNSYADCYLSGGNAGGLAGTAGTLTLTDCYAAGFIEVNAAEGNGSAGGLCAAGTVTGNGFYSVMRCTSAEADWKPLAPNVTGTNCYYLAAEASDTSEAGYAKTYKEMMDAGFATGLGGAFGRKDQDSHPYNLRTDLALTLYDFPGLTALPHYGDWSAQFVEASLVYYEQYGEKAYGFYGGGVDALQNNQPIKDGYAIAIRQEGTDAPPEDLKVTYGGKDDSYITKDAPTVEIEGTTFFLVPLGDELVNAETAAGDFYQPLSFAIGDETHDYYYCPHFAKAAVKTDELPPAPAGVSVRTPRHLYMLSLHPEYYCSDSRYAFHQELDLDYSVYTGYDLFKGDFTQVPIGRFEQPFNGLYDGGCHTIEHLVFRPLANTTRAYAGLFGYSSGTLRDIVYLMDVERQNAVSLGNQTYLYIGGLVGGNAGRVDNCAAAGVNLSGSAFTATIYIGGLAGMNQGEIVSCGAECAALEGDASTYAHAYVGGLVGQNRGGGIVSASYAVGRASADVDPNSNARVCGFVGYNLGLIQNSYAAMDLSSSGKGVETYGFCGATAAAARQEGTCFLNQGNFTYRDVAYNASYTPRQAAQITYDKLTDRTEAVPVAGMSFVNGSGDGDGEFPYPTAVRDAGGQPIHYGLWPERMELGTMGVYYWEKLEIGGVSTYHVSLMAVDPDAAPREITKQTTLSNAHSDNGVVTDYGYGYYDAGTGEDGPKAELTADGINYSEAGKKGDAFSTKTAQEDKDVNAELAKLMPGYAFHSYHSFGMETDGGGLYPETSPNGRFILSKTVENSGGTEDLVVKVEFSVNPHFADALSVTLPDDSWKLDAPATDPVTIEPGSESKDGKVNPYEVRAVSQLQNINWNSSTLNTSTVVYRHNNLERNDTQFPYLNTPSSRTARFWTQTHDLDGKGSATTPIAQYYDKTSTSTGALYAWFGGFYDGGSYMIQNLSIEGKEASSCVGLFGVVYNGTLKDIILYSSDGNATVTPYRTTDSAWYAIGTLAGIAATSDETKNAIQNCAAAGYTISTGCTIEKGNWGGIGVGGLVGISYTGLTGCTSRTNIEIKDLTINDNVRVGGLVGTCQRSITNCYAGGEVSIPTSNSVTLTNSGKIYIGGIVGGSYFKPLYVNGLSGEPIGATGVDGGDTSNSTNNKLANCYSSMVLPNWKTTVRDGSNKPVGLGGLYALGGTGDIGRYGVQVKANCGTCTITNCFYLTGEVWKHNIEDGAITIPNSYNADTTDFKTDLYGYPNVRNIATPKQELTGLTYRQLTGAELIDGYTIYQRLNNALNISDQAARLLGPFHPVTSTTDDGYSIAGKYSYPAKANLKGLNYPFPTILTREGSHVHYGDWPLSGIKRDNGGAPIELDLFTNPAHTEELELEGPASGGEWSVKAAPVNTEEVDENNEPITKEIVAATINENGELTVTGIDVGVTTVTVTYTDKDGESYSMPLSVSVTAVLELRTADSPIQLYTNDKVSIELRAYGERGSDGKEQELDLEALGLAVKDLTVTAAMGGYENALLEQAESGDDLTLNLLTGGTEGDTTVSINYTYTFGDVDYTGMSAITFKLEKPVIKLNADGTHRMIIFEGGAITAAKVTKVTSGNPDQYELVVDEEESAVMLNMADVNPGTEITVEVILTRGGREHVVTVTVSAEEDGGQGETGGGDAGQGDGGEQTG